MSLLLLGCGKKSAATGIQYVSSAENSFASSGSVTISASGSNTCLVIFIDTLSSSPTVQIAGSDMYGVFLMPYTTSGSTRYVGGYIQVGVSTSTTVDITANYTHAIGVTFNNVYQPSAIRAASWTNGNTTSAQPSLSIAGLQSGDYTVAMTALANNSPSLTSNALANYGTIDANYSSIVSRTNSTGTINWSNGASSSGWAVGGFILRVNA